MTAKKITTPNTSADEQDQSWISKETENTKSDLQENLDTPNVGDTMEFYFPGASESWQWYVNKIKSVLNTMDAKNLIWVKVICLEYTPKEGDRMTEFKGIDVALDIIIKNPNAKIILTSTYDIQSKSLNEKSDKINLLMSKPNVKFVRLPLVPQDLINAFKPQESQEEKEEILKTITFKMGISRWDGYEDQLKKSLRKLEIAWLKDAVFIDLIARFKEGQYLQQLNGIEAVLDELRKNPEKKIVVFSLLDNDSMEKLVIRVNKKDKFDLIRSGKNVRFFEYGEDPKNMEHLFDGKKSESKISDVEGETAFQKILESEINHFLHDAKYDVKDILQYPYEKQLEMIFAKPRWEKTQKLNDFEDKLIGLLQFQHPSFKKLPRENNFQWIIDAYKYIRAQVLPEDTRFEGVFIDRDGTLYDNDKLQFNQNIVDMMQKYEKEGKKIIIWTQGNLELKQNLLDQAGLKYEVKSKTDYKWGTVEIAIDNDSPEVMFANAKLKAEQHIKI